MKIHPTIRYIVVAVLTIGTLGAARAIADVEGTTATNPFVAVQGSISAGTEHTCAVMVDTTVKCWGSNTMGQLGDGTSALDWSVSRQSLIPVTVLSSPNGSPLAGVRSISAGNYHTCAVLESGSIQCWGWNNKGRLGDGTTTSRAVPVAVSGITNAVAVGAGDGLTCALLSTGTVKCWGNNTYGQLGTGNTTSSNTPVDVQGLSSVTSLAVGYSFACAIVGTSDVKCWGDNSAGQLGLGDTTSRSTPTQISNFSGVVAISAPSGGDHVCAVLSSGAIKCWGLNNNGQLGNNSTNFSSTPVDVITGTTSLPVANAVAIATGYLHSCASLANDDVRCWGNNSVGQLGTGNTTPSLTAVPVSGLTGVTAITTGDMHTCVVLTTTEMKCWGQNDSGRLGDNSTENRTSPVFVLATAGASNLVNVGITTTTTSTTTTPTTVQPVAASTTVAKKVKKQDTLPATGKNATTFALLGGVLIAGGLVIAMRRRLVQ